MIRIGDFKVTQQQLNVMSDILASGRITEGKYVERFERQVEKFLKVKHAIAVTNGTVALQLVAQLLKYKHKPKNGKQLVACIPATTFPATLNAFYNIGYKILLCDIGDDLCIDINKLTVKQKKTIDVIVPVHLMGYTCKMNKIMKEADKYNWVVVEDFAEAFGSTYGQKKVGTIGHYGCSSFYVSHVLQGGELGVVTSNEDFDSDIMRSMKNHGRIGNSMEFNHDYIGSNYKTTEFCAGLCYAQMKQVDKIIKRRQEIAKMIHNGIKNPKLKPFPIGKNYSFLGYPILCVNGTYRNDITNYLNENGIETRTMFPCLLNQNAYQDLNLGQCFPVSNRMEIRCFYVGCHQYLKNKEVKQIIKALNEG